MVSDANSASNLAQAGARASFRTVGFHIRWPGSEKVCYAVHWKNEVCIFCNHKFCVLALPSCCVRAILTEIYRYVYYLVYYAGSTVALLQLSMHWTLDRVVQVWALCCNFGPNVSPPQCLSPLSVGCKGDSAGVTLCIYDGLAPHLERKTNTLVDLTL